MANTSEKNLKAIIKDTNKFLIAFNLRPKDGNQWIENKKPKNVVEVCLPKIEGGDVILIFRGVREKYYDKLQKKYAKNIGFKYSGGAVEIL
jgi:hypothetical protein